MSELIVQQSPELLTTDPAELALIPDEIRDKVRDLIDRNVAESSRFAYEADWELFETYCVSLGLTALPALEETVVSFLVAARTDKGEPYKISSLRRMKVSIDRMHKKAGYKPQILFHKGLISEVLKSINLNDPRGVAQAPSISIQELDAQLAKLNAEKSNRSLRDAVTLALGFFGAFRRSELVAVRREDITFTKRGMDVLVRRSKTDQTGRGQIKRFVFRDDPDYCPVELTRRSLKHFRLRNDDALLVPIYRNDCFKRKQIDPCNIDRIVKRYWPMKSAHSLRVGFITESDSMGESISKIQIQTFQKSERTVNRYIRHGGKLDDNPVTKMTGIQC